MSSANLPGSLLCSELPRGSASFCGTQEGAAFLIWPRQCHADAAYKNQGPSQRYRKRAKPSLLTEGLGVTQVTGLGVEAILLDFRMEKDKLYHVLLPCRETWKLKKIGPWPPTDTYSQPEVVSYVSESS